MHRSLISWFCLLLLPALVAAQEDRMKLVPELKATEAAPGETITLKFKLELEPGFHTYPTTQSDPNASAFTTQIRVKTGPLEMAGKIKEPAPKTKFDPDLKATIGIYEEPVEMEVPLKIKAGTPPGKVKFSVRFQTQVCNESNCQQFEQIPEFEITIKDGKAAPNVPIASSSAPVANAAPKNADKAIQETKKTAANETTLLEVLLQAAGWGFISLLTPCVFPMIPITVSYFLKQKEGNNAVTHAFVYSGTIIIALSIFIYAFVDIAQRLTYHWGTNLFLGLLLIVFAVSLFGMFEIRLPAWLSNWTSSGQDRGGYVGTVFMALTFIIISFSCVSPIVGVFAGLSADQRPVYWNVLTALVFATCFALPFFALSLFPSMLKKLPKSGGWLNSLKIMLGLLEMAAALKFLRQSELNYKGNQVDYLTYDAVLASYIAMCFIGGIYLFRFFRMPHDDENYQQKPVGVGRFMWASLFIAIGIYLFPGMFWAPNGHKHRPAGTIFAWVDAFLLQGDDTKPLQLAAASHDAELQWHGNLPDGLKEAAAKGKRVFIDFTGINCQNCALNEKNIFTQEDVKEALSKYVLVKLYTDTVPLTYYPTDKLPNITIDIQEEDGKANWRIEKERFNTTELPFYAVVEPQGKDFKIIKRISVGLIKDKAPFVQDLQDGLKK